MSFYQQHKLNILNSLATTRYGLQRGMIIICRYTYEDSDDRNFKFYLILNPFFRGYIHALDLGKIPTMHLIELAKRTGIAYAAGPRFKKVKMDRLVLGDQDKFYNTILKSLLKSKFTDCYRTLIPNHLRNIRMINYKFPDSVPVLKGSDDITGE